MHSLDPPTPSFGYLPEGKNMKNKKRSGIMVQGQVFLKSGWGGGGGGLALF